MSMKNSNDTIGNRTHDLPTRSAMPQTTSAPRAFEVLEMLYIQGVPGGMCQTSGECSLS